MTDNNKAEVIFRQAIAYAAGAMSINNALKPHQSQENYEPLPYIMNLGFSIELFLKSLLKSEGKNIRGHEYLRLFAELSDDNKSAIVSAYGEERKNPSMDESLFNSEISPLDNAFSQWRYIYEKTSGTTGLEIFWFVSLANACMRVNIKNNPTWGKYRVLITKVSS